MNWIWVKGEYHFQLYSLCVLEILEDSYLIFISLTQPFLVWSEMIIFASKDKNRITYKYDRYMRFVYMMPDISEWK